MNKPDLDNCTLQEACDYAVFKIVEQGGRCTKGGRCAYGSEDGNHCAVGWLLDHDNKELMNEMGGVGGLTDKHGGIMPNVVLSNLYALKKLQLLHDVRTKGARESSLQDLSLYIDTTKPQYKQWVEMGDE